MNVETLKPKASLGVRRLGAAFLSEIMFQAKRSFTQESSSLQTCRFEKSHHLSTRCNNTPHSEQIQCCK